MADGIFHDLRPDRRMEWCHLAVSTLDFLPSQNFSSNAPYFFSIVLKLNKVFICTNFLVDSFCTRWRVSSIG